MGFEARWWWWWCGWFCEKGSGGDCGKRRGVRLGFEEEEEECGKESERECSGFEGQEKREGHSIIPCEEFASRPFVKSLSLSLSLCF